MGRTATAMDTWGGKNGQPVVRGNQVVTAKGVYAWIVVSRE